MNEKFLCDQNRVPFDIRYIRQLEAENTKLREAMKKARLIARVNGYSMREFAAKIGITAAQLSAWTDEIPDREPDFKD